MRSDLLMMALLAAGLAAPAAAAERTDPMALKATGEPVRCVPSQNVSTTPAGDRVLVFRNAQSRYCEMDPFDVVEPQGAGMVLASCTLGRFTPVEVPPGARF